jgi:uncharacterized C2H2 Zn-finger protein
MTYQNSSMNNQQQKYSIDNLFKELGLERSSEEMEKKYKCFCSRIFARPLDLQQHFGEAHLMQRSSENEEGEKTCAICSRVFLRQVDLVKHFSSSHLSQDDSITTEPSTSASQQISGTSDGQVLCKVCLKTFGKQVDFQRHFQAAHLKKEQSVTSSQVSCTHCNKTFAKSSDFNDHYRAKHSNLNQSSGNLSIVDQKPEQDYSNGRPCGACDRVFMKRAEFLQHYRDFHEKKKQEPPKFICKSCKKDFSKKSDLDQHNKAKHQKQTPVKVNNVVQQEKTKEVNDFEVLASISGDASAAHYFELWPGVSKLKQLDTLAAQFEEFQFKMLQIKVKALIKCLVVKPASVYFAGCCYSAARPQFSADLSSLDFTSYSIYEDSVTSIPIPLIMRDKKWLPVASPNSDIKQSPGAFGLVVVDSFKEQYIFHVTTLYQVAFRKEKKLQIPAVISSQQKSPEILIKYSKIKRLWTDENGTSHSVDSDYKRISSITKPVIVTIFIKSLDPKILVDLVETISIFATNWKKIETTAEDNYMKVIAYCSSLQILNVQIPTSACIYITKLPETPKFDSND